MSCSFIINLAAALILCSPLAVFSVAVTERRQNERPETSSVTEPKPSFPFEPAEELIYEGYFTKLMLRSISVAELSFTAKRAAPATYANHATTKNANADLRLTLELASKGIVPRLFGYHIHQRIESAVNPSSFGVQRTTRLDEQNERQRTSEAVFDESSGKVVWTERNPKDPSSAPRIVASKITGATQDIVSVFYFLRTQNLVPGRAFEVPLSDSGRSFRLPVTIYAGKQLKTVLGEVSTVRVDVDVFGEKGILPGDGNFSIWFTDDARHIPVQARIAGSMGTLDVKLKSRNLAPKQ